MGLNKCACLELAVLLKIINCHNFAVVLNKLLFKSLKYLHIGYGSFILLCMHLTKVHTFPTFKVRLP